MDSMELLVEFQDIPTVEIYISDRNVQANYEGESIKAKLVRLLETSYKNAHRWFKNLVQKCNIILAKNK